MMHEIKMIEGMGRGVIAKVNIPTGIQLMDCELLVFNEADTKVVNTTDLQWYTFKYNDTQDCLVLGDGEIFNHADAPNAKYELVEVDGRKKMRFTAIKDIATGEQIFIDYGADVNIDPNQYTTNMIG